MTSAADSGRHERDHDLAPHAQATAGAPDTKWWTLTAVCVGTFMLLLDAM